MKYDLHKRAKVMSLFTLPCKNKSLLCITVYSIELIEPKLIY